MSAPVVLSEGGAAEEWGEDAAAASASASGAGGGAPAEFPPLDFTLEGDDAPPPELSFLRPLAEFVDPPPPPLAEGEEPPQTPAEGDDAGPGSFQPLAALAAALAAALNYVASTDPAAIAAAAEAAGDAPAAPEPELDENGEPIPPPPPKLSIAEVERAMARERAVFATRIERISQRALAHATELREIASNAHERLEERLRARYRAECGAVAALVDEVNVAVDEERELHNDLVLDDVDFIVFEEERALPPPPPQPKRPATEKLLPPGVYRASQLARLAAALAAAAPTGLVSAPECAVLIAKCACADDGDGAPTAFTIAPASMLAAVANLFAFRGSVYVEWRALIVSLLYAAYPAATEADAGTLASAAAQLAAPAKAGKEAFAKARKLWFLPGGNAQEVDVSSIIMRALADAFAVPGAVDAETGESAPATVDVDTLAMHLCASKTHAEGVAKAMEVARRLEIAMDRGEKDFPEGRERERAVALGELSAVAAAAAMGPMSDKAIDLLLSRDLEGKQVDLPAIDAACKRSGGDETVGVEALLRDEATAKWYGRYLVRDAYEVVKV